MALVLPVQPNNFSNHAFDRSVQATRYLIIPIFHHHPCLIFPSVHTLLIFFLANGKQNGAVMLTQDRNSMRRGLVFVRFVLIFSGLSLMVTAVSLLYFWSLGHHDAYDIVFLSLFHMETEVQYEHGWVTWK